MRNKSNKMNIQDVLERSNKFNKLHSALRSKRKSLKKRLKNSICRNILKRKQNKINKELEKLKLNKLANINNISERHLANSKKCNAHTLKTLQHTAKGRNVNSIKSKGDIIYALVLSELVISEEKYLVT